MTHNPDPTPFAGPARRDYLRFGAYHLVRLGLAGVFIFAGLTKLLDPKAFAHQLTQFELVPDSLLPLIAVGLPVLEILVGAGLVLEVHGSLAALATLLVMFLGVLGYTIRMDLDIDCGCFTLEEIMGKQGVKAAFWRDLFMLAATLTLCWRRRPVLDKNSWPKKP